MYFMLLLDPVALSPADRRVTLRLGGGAGPGMVLSVFDQLGSSTTALGLLRGSDKDGTVGTVDIGILAGSARFLVLKAAKAEVWGG